MEGHFPDIPEKHLGRAFLKPLTVKAVRHSITSPLNSSRQEASSWPAMDENSNLFTSTFKAGGA